MLRLLGLALLAACEAPAPPSRPAVPPAGVEVPRAADVVLITIDTLRADYLGAWGGPARTPALDALAAGGWRFEECISASMLTNPSHASIMTSLYPRDHGVYDNESGVADGMRTLASALREAGMRTAAVIGFPHLNPEVSNLGQGFDTVIPATRDERRADATTRAALEVIDALAGERFFLWIHYTDPHSPYDPPPSHPARAETAPGDTKMALAVRAAPGFQKANPWFKGAFAQHSTTQQLVRKYVAEIEATDAAVGALVNGLKSRGRSRTAVVVTSDHGENLGEHDLYFHHGGLYRETVHVPLIVAVPGAPARSTAALVGTVDIAPTVLEIAGGRPWEPMRGRSLVPVAMGVERGREHAFSEHMLAQLASVRSKRGTLILHRKASKQFPSYVFRDGRIEVYDLAVDPAESWAQPQTGPLARELGKAMNDYLGLGPQLSARRAVTQDRESLRALGYVE